MSDDLRERLAGIVDWIAATRSDGPGAVDKLFAEIGRTHAVVPKEPTEAMLDAGVRDHRHGQSYEGARETWAAMLAAAPGAGE